MRRYIITEKQVTEIVALVEAAAEHSSVSYLAGNELNAISEIVKYELIALTQDGVKNEKTKN